MTSCLWIMLSQVPKSGPGAPRVGSTLSGQRPSLAATRLQEGLHKESQVSASRPGILVLRSLLRPSGPCRLLLQGLAGKVIERTGQRHEGRHREDGVIGELKVDRIRH